jgi:hypothetical protein
MGRPRGRARQTDLAFTTGLLCPPTHLKKRKACRPTVCVTRGWVGRGHATLTEPARARKLLENAATPTRRVHAVLGGFMYLTITFD